MKENEKLFYFKINTNLLVEVEKEKADIEIVLPKDTPVDELRFINGQVLWLDTRGDLNG